MKTSLMKLWVKLKTHKFKKKFKNNIVKGSLLLIAASFLIFLTYKECMQERNKELVSFLNSHNNIFEYLSIKETLKVLEDKTGIVVFVNDRKDINKFIDLLYDKDNSVPLYVCNVKSDETILKLDEEDNVIVKQRPSKDYKNLLERLGSFTEEYYLKKEDEIIETDYKRIITPMVLFVKNGKTMFSHYISDEELTDEELLDIYSKGFELVVE